MSETPREMKKLRHKLSSLKSQQMAFDEAARRLAEKRDSVHNQIRNLRLEISKNRRLRDTVNDRVKAFKTQRTQIRELMKEKTAEITDLKQKLRLLNARKPKRSADSLQREKEQVEWEIQTSSLTLEEEKPLVKRADQLEIQLAAYRQINDVKSAIAALQKKIVEMKEEAGFFHVKVTEHARESQELHEKMVEAISKLDKMNPKADGYHRSFLENKLKARAIREQYVEAEGRFEAFAKKQAEKEEAEKTLRQKETRRKVKDDALKKLKKGRKLSLEEFKLLSDEETT